MSPAALVCSPSTLVAPLLHGRRRLARVVGLTRAAVYLLPYGDGASSPYGQGAPLSYGEGAPHSYGKGALFPYGQGPGERLMPYGQGPAERLMPYGQGPGERSTLEQETASSFPYGHNSPFALVSPTGVRVPAAVLLSPAAGEHPFAGIAPGAVARVGDGRVELGPLRLTAGVSWAPPRVQGTPVAGALPALAELTWDRRLPGAVAPLAAQLAEALASRSAAIRDCVLALLGRGPGLTPSGDDYLCGLLLVANTPRLAPSWLAPLTTAVADAAEHTTLISASLLAHAATGHCIPQVTDLLRATAAASEVPHAPLAALLAVGHSSGSDLLHGLCAGARLLSGRPA
ncbi:DUF2877 domain-containing protein [Streptomyces sp. TRM66268-LWL]|uniref:DUF2877 domain-containing protein n=1 Tax=Streptomyces polyasparticus TaxID=2767826 RepID=A0ABR7STG0_9ACTN|nr:DUF2877 domain-containing protein [Streptomyces polyasparticus]MBC9718756.1 DUF2877 domain-containing protein [Streptomyces polyasparticus]